MEFNEIYTASEDDLLNSVMGDEEALLKTKCLLPKGCEKDEVVAQFKREKFKIFQIQKKICVDFIQDIRTKINKKDDILELTENLVDNLVEMVATEKALNKLLLGELIRAKVRMNYKPTKSNGGPSLKVIK